jgi:hypothetical protein
MQLQARLSILTSPNTDNAHIIKPENGTWS